MKRFIRTATSAVGCVLAYTFLAQPGLQAQRRPATLDATIGGYAVQSNRSYSTEDGFVFAATFVAAHQSSRILAVSAGIGFPVGQECLLLLPGGSCAPDFPALAHIAVAPGYEIGSNYLSARSTIGPAFYLSRTSGQSSGVGGQLTLDVAAGVKFFKAVAGGRYTVLRRKGETVRMPQVELGLRL